MELFVIRVNPTEVCHSQIIEVKIKLFVPDGKLDVAAAEQPK